MAVKASCTVTLSCYRDTQSVTRYYKLQSSTASAPSKPTANPPSGWTDSEPSYTSGSTNTLYFCDLTVFSDGTWSYSTVSKSSSYEAAKEAYNKAQNAQNTATTANDKVDNLEIGGRNLIIQRDCVPYNEYDNYNLTKDGFESTGNKVFPLFPTIFEYGEKYVLTFDLELDGSLNLRLREYSIKPTKWTLDGYLGMQYQKGYSTSGHVTLNLKAIYSDCKYMLVTFWMDSGTYIKVTNLKLEKGNKPTDWTPAPEDIHQEITDTETNIRQTISEKSSDIIKETESILLKALESYTETSDFNTFKSTMENQLQVLSDRTTLQFTQTTQELKKVNDDLQTKFNTITKYFTFNVNGLVIGQVDNPYRVIIDNDRYSMTVNDVEVMWIADGKVYTPEMEVTKALKIFDYLLDKDGSENVNCSYVGGES